jgi:hypothetical protein
LGDEVIVEKVHCADRYRHQQTNKEQSLKIVAILSSKEDHVEAQNSKPEKKMDNPSFSGKDNINPLNGSVHRA